MNWYMPPDQQHPGQSIGVIGLAVIIGLAAVFGTVSWFSNRTIDQSREIARQAREISQLSSGICPAVEAGEQRPAVHGGQS
ncbi:hypothetical protein [Nitrosospira sp. NpAV]|uniref:hypothetical protein n=1 Tax=Nitrosospira sp. NpAV TaxID=58133 RepID=UPI0005A18AD9|nr:hypothetical protein [Nitrosospira sp. NpAV]KIO49620.1 hypothetical protein SQ11_05745 [Nitrosospira sp. NpAV]